MSTVPRGRRVWWSWLRTVHLMDYGEAVANAYWLSNPGHYCFQQVEYCRNFVFRRNFPIHKQFERSCDLGLLRLTADKISQVFGWRLHKRLPGKLSSVLDRTDH